MAKVHFTDKTGAEILVDVRIGFSLMEAAVAADVIGIDADCRGACACATCHVWIDETWLEIVGGPRSLEDEILELADNRGPRSRLSCQIRMSPELDGLKVVVP